MNAVCNFIRKYSLMLILISLVSTIKAQTQRSIFSEKALGFTVEYSRQQRQSLSGILMGVNQEFKVNNKLWVHHFFSITLHSGVDPLHDAALKNVINVALQDPYFKSSPIKFITAGIQSGGAVSSKFLSEKVQLGAGPLIRYQTTNKPDDYTFNVVGSSFSNVPRYSTSYQINSVRPHTLSVGGLIFADVEFYKRKGVEVKATLMYQFDTRGDRILSTGFKIQKTYRKI